MILKSTCPIFIMYYGIFKVQFKTIKILFREKMKLLLIFFKNKCLLGKKKFVFILILKNLQFFWFRYEKKV